MPPPVKFRIRRARLEDLPRVIRLEKRVWNRMAAPAPVIRKRFFLFPQGFQVAVTRTDLAGFCFAAQFEYDTVRVPVDESFPPTHMPVGKYYFLFGLTVNPIYRRQGVASAIVRRELKVARKRKCRKIQLVANANSRWLFEKQGFVESERLDHLFHEHSDLMPGPVLMERPLRRPHSR